MTVYVNSPSVYKQLITYQEIFTLRDHMIADGIHPLATGNFKKGSTKIFGAGEVELICKITKSTELKVYVEKSGFATVDAWLAEAAKFRATLPLYLHHVKLIKLAPQPKSFFPKGAKI